MKQALSLFLICSFLGCATTGRDRVLFGAGSGAAVGAAGGAVLSPNSESRGINALVFGLVGMIVGGVTALLTDTQPPHSNGTPTLKERDQSLQQPSAHDYTLPTDSHLPEFVRERLQPVVIEESIQQDVVTEEGTLHEPHKVYRIKRMPELYSNPVAPVANGTPR